MTNELSSTNRITCVEKMSVIHLATDSGFFQFLLHFDPIFKVIDELFFLNIAHWSHLFVFVLSFKMLFRGFSAKGETLKNN